MTAEQAKALLLEKIPASGEIGYEAFWNSLQSTAEGREAVTHFHQLRRAGDISVRIDRATGDLAVSRPAAVGV